MKAIQEAHNWETLHTLSVECVALVESMSPRLSSISLSEYQDAPQLALRATIPDIRPELILAGIASEQVEACVLIFESGLLSLGQELQLAFEKAWMEFPNVEEICTRSQIALIELYSSNFRAEVDWRRTRVMQLAMAANGQMSADSCRGDPTNPEWTEETRALMERVYQQHPKLEAHEKKLLAEASGLSLRQISIWVSLILHLLSTLEPPLHLVSSWLLFSRCSCTDADYSVIHLLDVRNCSLRTSDRGKDGQ